MKRCIWLKAQGSRLKGATPTFSLQPSAFSGQSLVIVLWVMGIVSVAIGALAVRSTHELRLGRIPLASLQRKAIAQAAVQQAIVMMQRDDPAVDHLNETWATGVDGETETQLLLEVPLGEGAFSVGVMSQEEFLVGLVDEERKLNLNVATPEHLQRLLELIGGGDVDAQAIAEAIGDWRDEPGGAFCAGASPACHNGHLETVDELRLLPGMTPALFAALEPHVTVYGNETVNANTASATVLDALGFAGEQFVAQREQAKQPFSEDNPPPLGLGYASTVFTVPVEATHRDIPGSIRLDAVIDRNRCAPAPPEGARCVIAWRPR